MHPDILVIRHRHAGTPLLLSKHVDASVINAGDVRHEHPTQALLMRFDHPAQMRPDSRAKKLQFAEMLPIAVW